MSTKYEKYRNRIKKIAKDETWLSYGELDEFSEYLIRTLGRENEFSLYHYTPIYDNHCVDKLFLFDNYSMNDVYEGMALYPGVEKEYMTEFAAGMQNFAHIKCFSETWDNTLMWSHYGGKNGGLCIEYDFSKIPEDNDLLRHLYPVIYCPKRKFETNMGDIYEQCQMGNYDSVREARSIFLQKGNVWRYEKEWRLIYTKDEIPKKKENISDGNSVVLEFPYVKNIYIGPRSYGKSVEIIQKIKDNLQIQKNSEIGVYQVLIDDTSFNFSSEKIASIQV